MLEICISDLSAVNSTSSDSNGNASDSESENFGKPRFFKWLQTLNDVPTNNTSSKRISPFKTNDIREFINSDLSAGK